MEVNTRAFNRDNFAALTKPVVGSMDSADVEIVSGKHRLWCSSPYPGGWWFGVTTVTCHHPQGGEL